MKLKTHNYRSNGFYLLTMPVIMCWLFFILPSRALLVVRCNVKDLAVTENDSVSGNEEYYEKHYFLRLPFTDMEEFTKVTGVTRTTVESRLCFAYIDAIELDFLPLDVYQHISAEQFDEIIGKFGIEGTVTNLLKERLKRLVRFGKRLRPSAKEIVNFIPQVFFILDPWQTLITTHLKKRQFDELFHYTQDDQYRNEFGDLTLTSIRSDLNPTQIAETIAANVWAWRESKVETVLPEDVISRLLLLARSCPRKDLLSMSDGADMESKDQDM